jgi:uncharacterized protein (UPF0332 family)
MNTDWIAKYIKKSKMSIHEAEKCLGAELHRAAIARGYYGLYQAANAWMEFKGYPRKDETRLNWHHNEVNRSWPSLLEQVGVDDIYADAVYNTAQDFRVRIEYQTGPEPTSSDADKCVENCKRYAQAIWTALKKEGHDGNR